jgi:hypothetical protein
LIALVFALWAFAAVKGAAAFHAGKQFSSPPGAGGGGGIFYTGTIAERGWNCTMCHVDPPGRIRLRVKSDPPELFDSFVATPGVAYSITISMELPPGEQELGVAATRSNYNSLVTTVVDASGAPVGNYLAFAPDAFYAVGNASGATTVLASAGQVLGVTEWTFGWMAPGAGTGPVSMHVAVVDGNGAGSDGSVTLTDPFGDDVAVARFDFREGKDSFSRIPRLGGRRAAVTRFLSYCGFRSTP